jgi:hypothetical protein
MSALHTLCREIINREANRYVGIKCEGAKLRSEKVRSVTGDEM